MILVGIGMILLGVVALYLSCRWNVDREIADRKDRDAAELANWREYQAQLERKFGF